MTEILIEPHELATLLGIEPQHAAPAATVAAATTSTAIASAPSRATAPARIHILDTTVELKSPAFDGDHQAESGYNGWLENHLPGSRHLDFLDEFTNKDAGYHFAQPTTEHAHRILRELGITDDSEIILYDQGNGFWSARAWWSLRALGVQARVLNGGLAAWLGAGLPSETGQPGHLVEKQENPGTLTLTEHPELWATQHDVLAAMAGETGETIVCALGPDQFNSAAPTRYSRRGRIPTSVNLPARQLASHDDGTLTASDALAGARPVLPDPAAPVLLYCGGGISASYAALGLTLAGYARVRMYDGSLEEWSAQPELPLE